MANFYKDDWPDAQQRLEAWWKREIIDRAVIQVTAPLKEMKERPSQLDTIKYENNTDALLRKYEEYFSLIYWGGEAFPQFTPTAGPASLALFYGSPIHIDEERHTCWAEETIKDWEKDLPKFYPDNRWWLLIKKATTKMVKAAKGKFVVGILDYGPIDNLYLLRGGDFLTDLILEPDMIKEAIRNFQRAWFKIHDELYQIIIKELDGSSGWLNIWAPGRTTVLQCDISGMVSPEMFEKFFAPMIEKQAKWLDYSIYHLDSPEIAIHHLDTILDISDIDAIQWALATTSIWQWIPELKKVQKAGKGKVSALWLQSFFAAWPDRDKNIYFRPSARGIDVTWFNFKDKGGIRQDDVRDPVDGWMAAINPESKTGLVFLLDYDYLRWSYNCQSAYTTEWFYDKVIIPAGKSWETKVVCAPVVDMTGISYASDKLILEAKPDKKKLVFTARAAENKITALSLTASVKSVDNVPITRPETVEFSDLTVNPVSKTMPLSAEINPRECVIPLISKEMELIRMVK